MIVSHEHRLIFLKTRKTAGTSVEIALSRICGPDDTITRLTDEDEELRRSRGGRGPQHFESPPLPEKAFNHMPARGVRLVVGPDVWRDYFRFTIERNPWDLVVSQYYWRYRNEEAPPFDDFVRRPVVVKLADKNARIYRLRGEIAVDRVLRFESLASDLAELWAERGLPGSPELPHAKSHSRPARSYRELYTDETRDLVGNLFAGVVRDLGYEF
ncbi:hypothetical protein [Nocardioides sp.]|uniref:hypothetical protein n=1 Tax=Nocardioides sp. TaxID=35761 RepID=UPI00378387CE